MYKEDIEKINTECPYEQGIRLNPRGIPSDINELVIYGKYETGGYSGGSCWDDSDPQHYSRDLPKDRFQVLDLVLTELVPNITYLQYKEIIKLVKDIEYTENEYYGNCTDYKVEYIVLSELEAYLDSLK